MGKGRFLYQNLITDQSMITVSSLRYGIVTDAKKEGTGSASMIPSGNYTGSVDKEYIFEIDSVAAGAEIGQATFRWSNGGGAWNASGVSTSSTDILIESGLYVKWVAGSGDDFVIGDTWYIKGINLFNANALIDLDRDHRYRSQALESPNTITIDLGSAQEVQALILYDHNLTSGTTLSIDADDADTFDSDGGSPQFTESITWNSEKILHYLSTATTRRYWRLNITDAANSDGYIEIGELYLGPYLELTKNFAEGYSKPITLIYDQNKTKFGVVRNRFYNKQRNMSYSFSTIGVADVASLEDLLDAIANRQTGELKPVFFNDDSAYPSTQTWLVNVYELDEGHKTRNYFEIPLQMTEVVASV